jgi:hypothetical protein
MKHTITIMETTNGPVVDLPYLSKDQLGILIQSASMALRDHAARDQEAVQGQRLMGNVLEEQKAEPIHAFASGAVRSEEIKARYDLIPSGPLERLALRYGLGASKYGEYNWQKGMPFSDTYNHILVHLESVKRKYEQGFGFEFIDDDLAGAAWGCFALMFFGTRGDYIHRDEVKEKIGRIARESLEKMKAESNRIQRGMAKNADHVAADSRD